MMSSRHPEIGPAVLSENNRKITFSYNGIVNEVDRREFEVARAQIGLDDEIALLRIIIKDLVSNDVANYKALLRAIEVLALLLEVRRRIHDDKDDLKSAVRNVINDVFVPIFGRNSRPSGI